MEQNIESLIQDIKHTPKKKIKWVCPICVGGELNKQKVVCNTIGAELEVSTDIGELIVQVENDEGQMTSKFPIRYCPWCGRKIRTKLRKKEN